MQSCKAANVPLNVQMAVAARLREAGKTDVGVRPLITFTAAMDRARDADRLWYASARMFFDQPWVFQPREIVMRQRAELRDPRGPSRRASRAEGDLRGGGRRR